MKPLPFPILRQLTPVQAAAIQAGQASLSSLLKEKDRAVPLQPRL